MDKNSQDLERRRAPIFGHGTSGLEPVVLPRQADEGMAIIEKFEKHSEVGYAFILLTPGPEGVGLRNRLAYILASHWDLRSQQQTFG